MVERKPTRQHQEMVEDIKAVARQQMAVKGAAALSLGAIARALGLSTPALYRYFANRDALVTALVLDSMDALSQDCAEAVEQLEVDTPGERLLALVGAYRRWALARPQDYILVHGAIFPGYQVPVDQMGLRVVRVLQLVTALLADAHETGQLRVPEPYREPPPAVVEVTELITGATGELFPAQLLTIAYLIWLQVHALVWQEVGGHLPSELLEDGALFDMHVRLIGQMLGLLEA